VHGAHPLIRENSDVNIEKNMAVFMDINTLPLHQLPSRQNSIKNSIASLSVPIPPGREYTQEEADTIPWKYIGY
jgi:hypothetical protein